ncbi:MAG: hypothetical protein JWM28_226 [Chitinophagaceae bacterium]|nr:hypothetical protein [Chitinophagaceae bacterium]
MLFLRKMDWYMELGMLIIMIIAIPMLLFYSSLTGLFIPGIIQLVSASLNTTTFMHHGFKREIKKFWLFTSINLPGFLIGAYLMNGEQTHFFLILLLAGVTIISIYYLFIYKKLITSLELRNELAGFTKS